MVLRSLLPLLVAIAALVGCPSTPASPPPLPPHSRAEPPASELHGNPASLPVSPPEPAAPPERPADTDHDFVLDPDDRCPDAAETYEGTDDHDGCPDQASFVHPTVDGKRIELLEPIAWKDAFRGTLAEPEPSALRDLAALLSARPELVIEIHAHEAPRPDVYGAKPTDRQARTVMDWLVSRGIDPRRLTAKGYGESRPITSNATKEGRAANARVEVWLVEPAAPSP
jgi:OOP family OmpA-OmpF porin